MSGVLVLSRKVGEKVVIGKDITVTVAELRNGKVRLAFHAPSEVEIDREEVRIAKEREFRSKADARAAEQQVVAPLPAPVVPAAPLAAYVAK